jgi:uncharacterized protein (TIGR00369 family)
MEATGPDQWDDGGVGMVQQLMTRDEVAAFLDKEFPQINQDGRSFELLDIGPMSARMRLAYHERHLRPGGTISGPAMMGLADVCLYAAILGRIGPVALAVTTSLNFNFLRKPGQAALIADCRLLKVGRRLAVGEVTIHSDGSADIVCHATGTYSIPV